MSMMISTVVTVERKAGAINACINLAVVKLLRLRGIETAVSQMVSEGIRLSLWTRPLALYSHSGRS